MSQHGSVAGAMTDVTEAATWGAANATRLLRAPERPQHDAAPAEEVIPFTRPHVVGDEMTLIQQAIANSELSGDGAFTKRCHALLEASLGVPKALLTTSCTHALEMAALLLQLKPGDEVIVPSFTFVSTANAFALSGARPVFADVRPDTLNMDERQVESLITERTKAIVPVHYAGIGCEMDALLEISSRRGVPIVEDNAHGLYGKYKGRFLGTMGVLGTQSFHETKNFTCGEGGALLINDPSLVARAEIIREKGTDRSAFYRGEIDKYSWRDIGSSYLPSGMLAAYLLAQLSAREAIQGKRQAIWEYYHAHLADWAAEQRVSMPTVPSYVDQAYHMFYLLLPTAAARTAVLEHLKQRNIRATFHYVPLHSSPMGQRFGAKAEDCPVAEDVSTRLIRLPFFNDITVAQLARVVDALRSFTPG